MVHWGRRGRSEEARIQRLTFLSQQLTLEKRREKINTNQTVRDAALHGWIRVTVGLSPWEHYSAINKKINKPFIYLFSLPSPSPLISPLLLQGALLPSVSSAEGVFGRSRSRKDKKSRVEGVWKRRKRAKIILTISSNHVTSQGWQKRCPSFMPLLLLQLQVSFPQASSDSLRPPHPCRYLSIPLQPWAQLSGAPSLGWRQPSGFTGSVWE